MTPACHDCAASLDHCHGTLFLHVVGFAECSDPDCHDPRGERHAMVVECADAGNRAACLG